MGLGESSAAPPPASLPPACTWTARWSGTRAWKGL